MKRFLLSLISWVCLSAGMPDMISPVSAAPVVGEEAITLRGEENDDAISVSGTVMSSAKDPLPGVNVIIKGTNSGTTTDYEGKYSITIEEGQSEVLIFSFIGFVTKEVAVGNQSILDVVLLEDTRQLEEVIVTAIGIERDKRATGYATATVSKEQLTQKAEADPIRAMTGKVPGVNIQGGGGGVGSNTNITIRGNSSLTQNTQPLFIVDGVPFDNSSFNSGDAASIASGATGNQFTNRAFDLDPSIIESMTVLKGASAAALYGSRAANGVIVITTKAGSKGSKKGLEISFNSSYSFEEVASLPDFQSTYGSGQHQSLVVAFNGSYGPRFDEFDSVQHILDASHLYGTAIGELYRGKRDVYQAYPNNVSDFFQTGHLLENSIQINSGGEKANFSGGFSRMDNKGIIPNSEVSRTTMNFGGRGMLDNGFFINGSMNYVKTEQATPQVAPSLGGNSSVVERLLFMPPMYNLSELPFEDPVTGANVYHRTGVDNPYWVAKYAPYTSDVDRVFGKATVGYDIAPWLSVSYQIGFNAYQDARKDVVQRGSADVPLGRITIDDIYRQELDGNFLINASKDIAPELNARLILGHNANQRLTRRKQQEGNGIIVFGNNNFTNTATQRVMRDELFKQRFQGVFGDLSLSYKDIYFLNLVGRNDWSSTLPKDTRSYFYPSVSGSVIATEALNIKSKLINFVKLRGGIARVGNDAPPYQTLTTYVTNSSFNQTEFPFTNPGGTYNSLTLSNSSGTADLKPEFITEYEIGTEIQLINSRVGIDFTYYDKYTTNSIINITLPPSSGFTNKVTNIGEVRNYGVELGLNLDVLASRDGLGWTIFAAFTRNRNIVEDLGGVDQIIVGGSSSRALVVHRVGEPFGQLYGNRMLRDVDGSLLIGNNQLGRPLHAGLGVVGDPNPDYILGITNTFSYKGIELTMLFDYKKGGDMWSETAYQMFARGVIDIGDREAGRVVPGYLANAEGTGPLLVEGQRVRNNIVIANYDWWFTDSFGFTNFADVHVYDASVMRLREITLSYTVPKPLLEKTPFGSARISFSGRNLWFLAPNFPRGVNFDPETAVGAGSNFQGLDFMGVPTTKRYGVNLSLTF